MYKNILIIGAARSGKTTLAKKIVKEKGYNLISIDDIVSGFEAFPQLNIRHDDNDIETSSICLIENPSLCIFSSISSAMT